MRAERSRAAVIVATLDLLRDEGAAPTAADVAARAGVSLRLVFHHFPDMQAVLHQAVRLHFERVRPRLATRALPPLPFDRRLSLFVRERGALYEHIGPVRRAGASAPLSEETRAMLEAFREAKREQTKAVFAPELSRFPAAERRERLAGAQAAASFATWESLRTHQGLGEAAARRVLRRMLRALLT